MARTKGSEKDAEQRAGVPTPGYILQSHDGFGVKWTPVADGKWRCENNAYNQDVEVDGPINAIHDGTYIVFDGLYQDKMGFFQPNDPPTAPYLHQAVEVEPPADEPPAPVGLGDGIARDEDGELINMTEPEWEAIQAERAAALAAAIAGPAETVEGTLTGRASEAEEVDESG